MNDSQPSIVQNTFLLLSAILQLFCTTYSCYKLPVNDCQNRVVDALFRISDLDKLYYIARIVLIVLHIGFSAFFPFPALQLSEL